MQPGRLVDLGPTAALAPFLSEVLPSLTVAAEKGPEIFEERPG